MLHSSESFNDVELVAIIDGDTFNVNINNIHPLIGKNIPIRIRGIDAPEMWGDKKQYHKAERAKKEASLLLKTAKKITLKNVKRGKYFRLIADVYIDKKNLGDILIKKNLVKRYRIKDYKKY